MLSSENKYHIAISIGQKIEGIQLTLLDGAFETVYSGPSQLLDLELTGGIYKLMATFIDYSQEYPLIVEHDQVFNLDFDYPSVAPILSFKTTHEYFHQNLGYYSTVSTFKGISEKPNFLFFAAKCDKDMCPGMIMENLLSDYSIIDKHNNILYQFNSETAKFDNDYGWLAFSSILANGLFFLKWASESGTRIFPFYIYDNYQTQFFIRYSNSADFENCLFFYTKKLYFTVDAEEYLVLDKILFAYKDYNNYKSITDNDKLIIEQHPYLVTLIHILQTGLSKEPDYENCEHLALPDLKLLLQENEGLITDENIPVISSVMAKYTFRKSGIDKMKFKPASLIDRVIDNMKYDLFWNNFSKIENATDWLDLYKKFVNKSDLFPISSNDNQMVKLGKQLANRFMKAGKDKLDERLNSLMGKVPFENYEGKISNIMNSIGDVSEVADKLNLPPTKVLRNYEIYKGIYDELK